MKAVKEQYLASKIAKIISVVLLCVFVCLIGMVTVLTGKGMREAVSDEFSAMAKGTGLQIKNVLDSAEDSAQAVGLYIQENLKSSTASEDRSSKSQSAVYGTPISPDAYEAEKYITQTVRQSVKSSDNIVGMGVLFEPYVFDKDYADYSFYISNETADQALSPYLPYAEFSTQEYYTEPKRSNSTYVTAPYEDAGYMMVTYCQPIMVDGRMSGVVTSDINVSDFSKTVFETDKYSSKYTTIINESGLIIYDSEILDNVGANLTAKSSKR